MTAFSVLSSTHSLLDFYYLSRCLESYTGDRRGGGILDLNFLDFVWYIWIKQSAVEVQCYLIWRRISWCLHSLFNPPLMLVAVAHSLLYDQSRRSLPLDLFRVSLVPSRRPPSYLELRAVSSSLHVSSSFCTENKAVGQDIYERLLSVSSRFQSNDRYISIYIHLSSASFIQM